VCTTDACVAHGCTHTNVAGCCVANEDCDDFDVCTTDHCDSTGACSHAPIAGCGDAGGIDGGTDAGVDAAMLLDATTSDVGPRDAGRDAHVDGSAMDAMAGGDTSGATPPSMTPACGCREGTRGAGGMALTALGIAIALARRRRRG
jgi:hypothetical protein